MPKKSQPSKLSLLEQAAELTGSRRNWIEKIPSAKIRAEVIALLQAKKRGEIRGTERELAELLNHNGIEVTPANVHDALNRLID